MQPLTREQTGRGRTFRQGRAVKIALQIVHLALLQKAAVLLCLSPFAGHAHSQRMTKFGDCHHDGLGLR